MMIMDTERPERCTCRKKISWTSGGASALIVAGRRVRIQSAFPRWSCAGGLWWRTLYRSPARHTAANLGNANVDLAAVLSRSSRHIASFKITLNANCNISSCSNTILKRMTSNRVEEHTELWQTKNYGLKNIYCAVYKSPRVYTRTGD